MPTTTTTTRMPWQRQQQQQRRTATTGWLSFFLFLLVLATTALLLGLLTPSWQVVFLEDGRTEHHHGLWLDCKRDFSYDYGRPREYYETLHRRFDLAGPFDQFWMPSLNCVFKFDYWQDEEDWFEHSYDENKLWGDAYQHLFIGWKIAALAAHLVSALCALFAVISLICAFCHRLCTCIAAVLVVIAVLSGLGGNILYYMFASDQDNNVIKEEDGLYQQHFGWSFWVSLLGNLLMLFCSLFGCVATKMVLGKGSRRSTTKLIKIQLNDLDDDSAHLLNQNSGVTGSTGTSIGSQQMPPPFRRSRSTVYKIDSQELRQWERDTMRNIGRQKKQQQQQQELLLGHHQFKRTNSVPSFSSRKGGGAQPLMFDSSTSDLSRVLTEPPTQQFIPRRRDHSPNSQNDQRQRRPSARDVIYEYVDQPPPPPYSGSGSTLRIEDQRRFYDPVPLANTQTSVLSAHHPQQQQQQGQLIQPLGSGVGGMPLVDTADYLQPKSLTSSDNSSIAASSAGRRTPLIVPVEMRGFSAERGHQQQQQQQSSANRPPGTSTFGVASGGPCAPQVPLATFPAGGPPKSPAVAAETERRELELRLLEERTTTTITQRQRQQQQQQQQQPLQPFEQRTPFRSRSTQRLCPPMLSSIGTTTANAILSEVPPLLDQQPSPSSLMTPTIRINTFQQRQQENGITRPLAPVSKYGSRSITDLLPLAGLGFPAGPSSAAAAQAFDHRRLTESSTTTSSNSTTGTAASNGTLVANGGGGGDRTPTFLGGGGSSIRERLESILQQQQPNGGSPAASSNGNRRAPSEADRSVGSSRAGTLLGGPEAAGGDGGSPAGSNASESTIVRRNGSNHGWSWTDV